MTETDTMIQTDTRYENDRVPMHIIIAAYMAIGESPSNQLDPISAICTAQGNPPIQYETISLETGVTLDGSSAYDFWFERRTMSAWQDGYFTGWSYDGTPESYSAVEESRGHTIAVNNEWRMAETNPQNDARYAAGVIKAWNTTEFDLGFAEGHRHRRAFERLGYTIN